MALACGPRSSSPTANPSEASPKDPVSSVSEQPEAVPGGGLNEAVTPAAVGSDGGPTPAAAPAALVLTPTEAFGDRATEVLAVTFVPDRAVVAVDLIGDAASLDVMLADARYAYDRVMSLPKAKQARGVDVTYANVRVATRTLQPDGLPLTIAGNGLVFVNDPADFELHVDPSAKLVTEGDYSDSWVTCKGTVKNASTQPIKASVRCSAFATKLGNVLRGTPDETRLAGEATVEIGSLAPGESKSYKTKVKGELPRGFTMEQVTYAQEVLVDGRSILFYDEGLNRRSRRFLEMTQKLEAKGFRHRALDPAQFHIGQGYYNFWVEPAFFEQPHSKQQKQVDVLWSTVSKYVKKNFDRRIYTLYLSDGVETRTIDGGKLKKKKK